MLTIEQRIFLARSKEFQKILNSDAHLDALSRAGFDKKRDLAFFYEIINNSCKIGSVSIRPLTSAIWSLLWYIENHYVWDIQKIDKKDTDIFLYLLTRTQLDFSPEEISQLADHAANWCPRHGLSYPAAASGLIELIRTAFKPLELLPFEGKSSEDSPVFDTDWLIRLCCTAAAVSGYPVRYVIQKMPLSLCLCCYIQFLRKSDSKGVIRRRTPGDIAREIVQWTDMLGEQYIRDHRNSFMEQTNKKEAS